MNNQSSVSVDPTVYTEDASTRAWFLRILKNTAAGAAEAYDGKTDKKTLFGLFHLAQRHGVLPIIAHGLIECNLIEEEKNIAVWQTVRDNALVRYVNMDALTRQIASALEESGIDYVLLKGAGIRALYPEPWMRISSDIDVLVREEDLEKAADTLCVSCGLEAEERKYHDIKLVKRNTAIVELHFSIKENCPHMDRVLDRVWSYAEAVDGTHEYRMTPSFFLFHQITHAAYHLNFRGCGIRPFLDMYIIRRKMAPDENEVRALCEESGLAKFNEACSALCGYFFAGGVPDDTTETLADYVLGNRLFGSNEQRAAVRLSDKSRSGYVFERLFVRRDMLETMYPSLRGRTVLLPFYQVKRWTDALFKRKKLGSFIGEIKDAQNTDPRTIQKENDIRTMIGLDGI